LTKLNNIYWTFFIASLGCRSYLDGKQCLLSYRNLQSNLYKNDWDAIMRGTYKNLFWNILGSLFGGLLM